MEPRSARRSVEDERASERDGDQTLVELWFCYDSALSLPPSLLTFRRRGSFNRWLAGSRRKQPLRSCGRNAEEGVPANRRPKRGNSHHSPL